METITGARIQVVGVVQGVGFRPFVYGLAHRNALTGWVRNTSSGVDIAVNGSPAKVDAFLRALKEDLPPLAHIDELHVSWLDADGFTTFEILESATTTGAFQAIPPDVSICQDCLEELFDTQDRRYRYPFNNCTNCGPRFTIIRDIPYDRPNTTMAGFKMCRDCAHEYHDPFDRRFHAQPVACPSCGPGVWLEVPPSASKRRPISKAGKREVGDSAIQVARRSLREGKILAIKGLGGYHLACDATDPVAVARLRRRKLRVEKPFALMMPDLQTVEANCQVNAIEKELLCSRERPIVILKRRPKSQIAREVAPGQDTLGVMLPNTPLHHLLLERAPGHPTALVMTSGNMSEEPIATTNQEARARLGQMADAFLMHNRDIQTRCDDSVVRAFRKSIYPLRRSRGYVPAPISLPWETIPLLATGGELKNAFCLTRGRYAFLSHHIGDLENYETYCAFQEGISHFERLFRVRPERIAYDLHPDYLATRYALERADREDLPAVGVQHHHAHIAACMAENRLALDSLVIGVAFDGTGYGVDGAIWGGEFLLAGYGEFQRPFHLRYIHMPGGEAAVREPWRLALAWLRVSGIAWERDLPPVRASSDRAREVVLRQLERGINAPLTSSVGRLFDAVAAITGVRQRINYEAQAAIELEAKVNPGELEAYPFEISSQGIDPTPMIQALVADLRAGVPTDRLAARFHNGVASMVLSVCQEMRSKFGLADVILSGGVWQNTTLLQKSVELLTAEGFSIHLHRLIPSNDGGLALGQAIIAQAGLIK